MWWMSERCGNEVIEIVIAILIDNVKRITYNIIERR